MKKSDFQELLATLYLRLNGYLTSGFIVHAPEGEVNDKGKPRKTRTELDILAVRFPCNAEPEREIGPSEFLQTSNERLDVLICEVKGGNEKLRFNPGLQENDDSIKSVLRWIGTFREEQIREILPSVREMLTSPQIHDARAFREVNYQEIRLRAVFFGPDRPEIVRRGQRRYISGQEMISYIWKCMRPDKVRPNCRTYYEFGLWGTSEQIVELFKNKKLLNPPTIEEIYGLLDIVD